MPKTTRPPAARVLSIEPAVLQQIDRRLTAVRDSLRTYATATDRRDAMRLKQAFTVWLSHPDRTMPELWTLINDAEALAARIRRRARPGGDA